MTASAPAIHQYQRVTVTLNEEDRQALVILMGSVRNNGQLLNVPMTAVVRAALRVLAKHPAKHAEFSQVLMKVHGEDKRRQRPALPAARGKAMKAGTSKATR